jgi:8-oxo-dGTP pyrophosphatase MutT (NUDIX family)
MSSRSLAISLHTIQSALTLPHFDEPQIRQAQNLMSPRPRLTQRPQSFPGEVRLGGVLILFYRWSGQTYLVLTRRRDDLRTHAGQISFPGGRHEAPETLQETALRETEEEIGIAPDAVKVLGQLTPVYILPSDFEVHPFVGWYENGSGAIVRPAFSPDPAEVAEIIEVPLTHLLSPDVRREEPRTISGYQLTIPYFAVGPHKVWGATAVMLSELLERLRLAGNNRS